MAFDKSMLKHSELLMHQNKIVIFTTKKLYEYHLFAPTGEFSKVLSVFTFFAVFINFLSQSLKLDISHIKNILSRVFISTMLSSF
jgi:hypothetical protein